MTQLDRLERMGFVVRRSDPRDRRTRIPEITAAGNALRAKVARACDSSEAAALNNFSQDQVQIFRRMLFDIIGDSEDRGSCLQPFRVLAGPAWRRGPTGAERHLLVDV
jgi:MarR family transcriptional regulator, organic hydroperoxide resistance regulator